MGKTRSFRIIFRASIGLLKLKVALYSTNQNTYFFKHFKEMRYDTIHLYVLMFTEHLELEIVLGTNYGPDST